MTPKRDDWESDFAYIRYLSLITGEGARQMAAKRGLREFSTGPRDWELTWDMELSVWDFRKRPVAERVSRIAVDLFDLPSGLAPGDPAGKGSAA